MITSAQDEIPVSSALASGASNGSVAVKGTVN